MHNFKLKGFFSWEIVDEKSGLIVKNCPRKNNLILTQGINDVALRSFAENIAYCAVGSGTTAPLLSDTGLASEQQRTGNIDDNVTGGTTTLLSSNVYSLIKTFRFPTNTSSKTFGEIGWSYSSSAGNNLFSKALVVNSAGVPTSVTLGVGQYLRVKYTLQITITPYTNQTGSVNIIGWSATGTWNSQLIGLKSFGADGTIGNYDAGNGCNEPSASTDIFIGTDSSALSAFGSSANRSSGTNYTNGSTNTYLGGGILKKSTSFGKTNANSTTLRSLGIGLVGSSYTNSGFVVLFDSNQTKTLSYSLEPTFTYSWS